MLPWVLKNITTCSGNETFNQKSLISFVLKENIDSLKELLHDMF